MSEDLKIILSHLESRVKNAKDFLQSPCLYLDPEGVLYLFRELTALKEPPSIRVSYQEGGRAELSIGHGSGESPPLHVLYEAIYPTLQKKIASVQETADLEERGPGFALVNGILQGTRFPDGNLNMEIIFAGVRGLLFYHSEFFSSVFKPLLVNDRFHKIHYTVEALVFIQDKVQQQIFYHHTYGDNKEHSWVPLVPVVIKILS